MYYKRSDVVDRSGRCHPPLSPVVTILLAFILMLALGCRAIGMAASDGALSALGFSWELVPVWADEPVVRGVLFWAETCPHCHEVIDRYLPSLEEKYSDQLQIRAIEVSDPAHYRLWLAAMDAYQVPTEQRGVPMIFVGDTVLIGSGEISEKLPGLVDQHLAEGGVDYPTIPGLENILEMTPMPAADLTPRPTPADDVAVHFWLFYSSKCGPCHKLKEEILPPILSKYEEGQVVIEERDLEHGSYELMRSLEKQHGLEYGAMPEIFIGEHVLLGNEEIEARLELLIDTYLAQGGIDLPQASTPIPTPEATVPEEAGRPPIHLAYFYQSGCQECDRVQLALNYLQDQYPQLTVCTLDVKEQATLCEWLGERASVPVGKRLTAPAVFVGDDALVGEELHTSSLEALLARYAETGAEPICVGWEAASDETVSGIIERFRSFSLPTVLVAGLVDGLNPCAFATLVFFISYLAFMGREGREVLLAGGAFALGVFLTYLGVGFGVLKFLSTLSFLDAASRWIYGLTAVFCFLLAVGSLYDWWQARRGKATEMRLKLPTRLRRWVNRTIREGAGAGALMPVTFATGVVVSIIELACTGQVYLPTILFVLGVPELQVRAGLYLVLYNLMFILPLVVVFVLAYFGTTSQQLGLLIHRHTATVKLATAGLFFLLAGWMVVTLI